MYNSRTEEIIRNTPRIGQIDIDRLPQELTRVFAEIVALRKLSREMTTNLPSDFSERINLLRSLANNLETIAIIYPNHEKKNSVAFVGATAHYLLMQIRAIEKGTSEYDCAFNAGSISSAISAILLFLIGNSPADAAEVASKLSLQESTSNIHTTLCILITALAKGSLHEIEEYRITADQSEDLETMAVNLLWKNIAYGIKQIASRLLRRESSEHFDYFQNTLNLSVRDSQPLDQKSIFAGPFHLARLLKTLENDLLSRGIINIPPPSGVDGIGWISILEELAKNRPYLWENHHEAIHEGFLEVGTSAVLTFPTGAGKSTLSELKIASTYLAGKSVIYLVPTHALEDQIKENLQKLFGNSFVIDGIPIDSEYTEIDQSVPRIAVMTPERCLTIQSVDPERLKNVGLVVFDEFHLIHGRDNRNERRNIDAMFCLLSLFSLIPQSDFLMISAMVENGKEIADWISTITTRPCKTFDSSWKPTRQMHGCLVFQENEINRLAKRLYSERRKRATKTPPVRLRRELKATPLNYFSLRNIWDSNSDRDYHITNVLKKEVLLSANSFWRITSNRNDIAAEAAVHFASLGMKTLVFVDNPKITNSTSKKIKDKLPHLQKSTEEFEVKYARNIHSLRIELGDLKYSYFSNDGTVGVHHGDMLPIERRLNEVWFKKRDGLNVVVATATLAQGINLPAEVVIIAGDDRFDGTSGNRERVEPYEILNAAGRAGRAGMAAQGVVFVIPGEIVTIKDDKISDGWKKLRDEVFSKSDQCLKVNDPLEHFLDSVQIDSEPLNKDQKNFLFRLKPDKLSETETKALFNKSLAAFRSSNERKSELFETKVQKLITKRNEIDDQSANPQWVEQVSLKMGLEPRIIKELGESIDNELAGKLETLSVIDSIKWLINWLTEKEHRFSGIFIKQSTLVNICKIFGIKTDNFLISDLIEKFKSIDELVIMYVTGATYESIEMAISDRPDECLSKTRTLILKIIPELSFVFGIFSLILREKAKESGKDPNTIPYNLRVLASCIREGFDTVEKLNYKYKNYTLSRVECHLHNDFQE